MSDAYVERLLIEADANARKADQALADLMDTVHGVEDADPTVTADAETRAADRALDDTAAKADDLDGVKPKITPEVDPQPATEGLGRVADASEGHGGEAGKRFGASFIRDVGASLGGGAEGPMADFADGLTTAAESLGIGSTLAGTVISGFTAAFGVGAVAFLAVKKFFDYLNQSAEESKKRVAAITDALASADVQTAAKALQSTYGDLVKKANEAGASTETVTRFISGQSTTLGDLDAAYQRHLDNLDKVKAANPTAQGNWAILTAEIDDQAAKVASDLVPALRDAQTEWSKSSSNLADVQRQSFATAKALGATSAQLLDQAQNALPAVQKEILQYILTLNGVPASKITEILAEPNEQALADTRHELDALTQARSVAVTADLKMTQQMMDFVAAMKKGQTVASSLVGIPTGTVQNIPTVQAARTYSRQNGSAQLWP